MPGMDDDGRFVGRCVKKQQGRVFGRGQGMPCLFSAGALVVEVEPQAGDGDDVVGLAAPLIIGGPLATDTNFEVAVLFKVEVGNGVGDGKPESVTAWSEEDGEPAGFGATVEGAFEGLWTDGYMAWFVPLAHGIVLSA